MMVAEREQVPLHAARRGQIKGNTTSLEICVDDCAGLVAAQMDCVSRIELCAALDMGGITPSCGLIDQARLSPVPVFVMIRPRAGSFEFSSGDEAQMKADIAQVRAAGLAGVVLGASLPGGDLDKAMLGRLVDACGPLRRQLHRAIDLAPDPLQALDTAIDLGFERVLTSGQARRAVDGSACLARLVDHAGGRIDIMAGSGVRPENAAAIMRRSGVKSLHASCREAVRVQDEKLDHFGFAALRAATSATEIIRLHEAIRSASQV